MNKTVLIAALLLLSGSAFTANWAVLVAGSNGFYNYRHQADICHAYQVLVKGGIPASNIIVFSYDDVAGSSQNPLKGKLINQPDVKMYMLAARLTTGQPMSPQRTS